MTDSVPIKLYLDEHIWSGLPQALAQHGYDAVHACALGHVAWEDSDHLAYAAEQGRAVLTFNTADFELLAAEWFFAGREHDGQLYITLYDDTLFDTLSDTLLETAHC